MNEKSIDVLGQYDLDIIRTMRVRGAILCETRQGTRLLQEYRGAEEWLSQIQEVLNQLEEYSGIPLDRVILNKEEKLITADEEGNPLIVKEWCSGRECNLMSEEEVLAGVRLLARLHRGLRQIDPAGFKTLGDIRTEYERHTAELKRARNFVKKARHKSDFELEMIRSFEMFYEQAEEAIRMLVQREPLLTLRTAESDRTRRDTEVLEEQESGILLQTAGIDSGRDTVQIQNEHEGLVGGKPKMDLEKGPGIGGYLCHGEYSHHHILYDGDYSMVTDFLGMERGLQVSDLYYFMRKTLEKQGFTAMISEKMLEEYDRILPLSSGDREYLYIRFLFPEKYWKQVNYYFNTNKAWIPHKNAEKLRILREQEPARRRFLETLKDHCG